MLHQFFLLLCLCLTQVIAKHLFTSSFFGKISSFISNHRNEDNQYLKISGGYASDSSVKHIHDKADLDDLIANPKNKGKLVVIDFTAKWCGPCKMIAPLFDEMSEEFSDSCIFVKVDVDEAPEISAQHQVMSMPTFLFIKNGKVVDRFSGASVEKLRQVIFSKID